MSTRIAVLRELAGVFLKLGAIGFGGPAAHIAMMEEETVKRRNWVSREHFLDLLGVTNLIPGPNSTEMAIHIGYHRAGWKGLIVAGLCFILPAVAVTLLLAHLYVRYGSLPEVRPFVSGIQPAILAVILAAVFRLGASALKNPFMAVLGVLVLVVNLIGVDEILLLLASGAAGLLWTYRRRLRQSLLSWSGVLSLWVAQMQGSALQAQAISSGATIVSLGLFFLKIGSILYGSGYVLVAFLQAGLVDSRHWLTQSQLFDAIAVGQFTPGPLLSTATFIGYVILGVPGAVIATTGIFLPSFLLIPLVSPFIPKLRASRLSAGFLDGVNAASLGLMLAVTVKLAAAALTGVFPWLLLVLSAGVIIYWRVNAAWIVLGAAILGWIVSRVSV